MSRDRQIKVLFVCMGNICRSPMAEAIFRHHANESGMLDQFEIDSAGTGGWHAGDSPDSRMCATAEARGITMDGLARQIRRRDLHDFDYVLCMDSDNLSGVRELGEGTAVVERMLEYHHSDKHHEVPDPYYGGGEGFNLVFDLLDTACRGLLESLCARHDLKR
ncbi:MAG: low molecular weight phosphotyrosine protein phosphatase [Planctomycetes bacterium]|nr:low molecular weight phosphotyrosine protein phosphatase [Planctomycetota bacterium]MCP4840040.1 low molecular weight phosphotyrosine protein phosphatase [Planctomycetota bacterium]